MAKRGRPRIDRPAIDRGTPEMQARRGPDQRNSYPLGVLFMAGDIDDEQHQAGCRYAWLYGFTCGRTSTAAVDWTDAPGGSSEGWDSKALERAFKEAAAALAVDRRAKDAVDNLVVFGRAPRWMQPRRPTQGDVREAEAFHRGLGLLVDLLGARTKAA